MKTKIISFISLISILFVFFNATVSASDNDLRYKNKIFSFISCLEGTNDLSISFVDDLFEPEDNTIIAKLYSVNDGYAIIGKNSLEVYEYSISATNPYLNTKGKKYYSGYFEYFDSEFKHIYNSYLYHSNSSSLEFIQEEKSSPLSNVVSYNAVPRANSYKKLSKSLPTDWINGYCGPTSAYNMLAYKGYVPDYLMPGTVCINFINNLINPNGGSGVTLTSLKNGMNDALEYLGYSKRVASSSYSFNLVKRCINKDEPLTLGTSGGGLAQGGHVQTIHGYGEILVSSSPTYVLYVNNSWGKNDVSISYTGNTPAYLKDHVYYL